MRLFVIPSSARPRGSLEGGVGPSSEIIKENITRLVGESVPLARILALG